ncbi:AzlD family protein [Halorussus caseinilyticus]|uniref:AzlD family protein n=1 Tax=Halorussus caseinilyticus TaxID=3034025 RepID=A0ABD5WPV1_9EURY|nr:AzlD domain-containing protein [Halorussus sp. DT72]
MFENPLVVATIVGMAAVTYVTRIGGFWMVGQFDLSDRFHAWLEYIPGAVLVSLVAPSVAKGGPAEAGAALAALVVSIRTGNILFAMLAGIGVVVALRQVFG